MLYLYYLELRLLFQTWFHLKTPFSKTPLLLSHRNKIAIGWRYQYSSTWNGKIWWLFTWDESAFLEKKILHHFRQAFWYGRGVRYHQKKFQNRDIGGFWEIVRFVRSNGRKTTFEWPKVVSEVSFPRFWGVLCIAKCFRFFVSVIGSAVSEI